MSAASVREEAEDLLHEYVEHIDTDRLEQWLDLFTEDASYRILPRENLEQELPACIMLCTGKDMLRDRITSLRHANIYNPHYDRHLVSAIRVAPQAREEWILTANFAVYQSTLEGESRLFSVGGYRDRVRREGGRLRFCEKLVIVDTFAVPSLLATPL